MFLIKIIDKRRLQHTAVSFMVAFTEITGQIIEKIMCLYVSKRL